LPRYNATLRTITDRFIFFNDTPTTQIYTLSLHDALPISKKNFPRIHDGQIPPIVSGSDLPLAHPFRRPKRARLPSRPMEKPRRRSEEHTSELQSPCNLVCRLLLEKKKIRIARPARTVSIL